MDFIYSTSILAKNRYDELVPNGKDTLKQINSHQRDSLIYFDEPSHKYTVYGRDYISATTFISQFFSKFDTKVAINSILRCKRINDPSYEYFGMNAEEISEKWKLGNTLGTLLHFYIEQFYNNNHIDNNFLEYQYFLNFFNDTMHNPDYIPFNTEKRIYSNRYKIAGSIDMIFKKANGHYNIYDWKRAARIDFTHRDLRYPKFGLLIPEMQIIPDVNYYKYAIQQNLYKRILEDEYGYIIDELFLLILHPNNENYIRIPIPIMKTQIDAMLNYRLNEISI